MTAAHAVRGLIAVVLVTSAAGISSSQTMAPGALYTHPHAGFEVIPPAGWILADQLVRVDLQMKDPEGEGFIEIATTWTSIPVDVVSYAGGWESCAVGAGRMFLAKRGGRPITIDGDRSPAYEGVYEADGVLAKVIFVGLPDRVVVFAGVFKAAAYPRGEVLFNQALLSFRTRPPA